MGNIIHIVFSENAEGNFKQAINRTKSISGDKIIALYDNLSNGFIADLKNLDERERWWNILNEKNPYCHLEIDRYKENYDEVYKDINELRENDTIYLWYGRCDREICGMLFALYLLRNKSINAYLVNVSGVLLDGSAGGVVWSSSASEIGPEKLGEYFKGARKIDCIEHKDLVEQWKILINGNSKLRTYRNQKVESVSEDYFDKDILKFSDKEYNKLATVVGNFIINTEPKISEDYIFFRIKELVKSGKMNAKGSFGVIKDMELCITEEGFKYLSSDDKAIGFWNKRKSSLNKHTELINEIKEQGRIEERVRIAKNLLNVLNVAIIADKTGMTVVQVRDLQK